jgi:hypothetical protein
VDKLTVDLDLGIFFDAYKERIEAIFESRMKVEAAQVKENGPKKPVAKSMIEALRRRRNS